MFINSLHQFGLWKIFSKLHDNLPIFNNIYYLSGLWVANNIFVKQKFNL